MQSSPSPDTSFLACFITCRADVSPQMPCPNYLGWPCIYPAVITCRLFCSESPRVSRRKTSKSSSQSQASSSVALDVALRERRAILGFFLRGARIGSSTPSLSFPALRYCDLASFTDSGISSSMEGTKRDGSPAMRELVLFGRRVRGVRVATAFLCAATARFNCLTFSTSARMSGTLTSHWIECLQAA